jgi:hypothetical protein
LVLTTVCAAGAGLAASMKAPLGFQAFVAAYLMLMAAYVVLRVPYLCRRWLGAHGRGKQIRRRRDELKAFAADLKAKQALDPKRQESS